MGCAGKEVPIEDQVKYAHNAGFRGQALWNIVAIAGAESCGGRRDSIGPDTPYGNALGILQILGNPTNLNPFDPSEAFKIGWIKSNNGTNFCPWATYDDGDPNGLPCPGHGTADRNNSYRGVLAQLKAFYPSVFGGASIPGSLLPAGPGGVLTNPPSLVTPQGTSSVGGPLPNPFTSVVDALNWVKSFFTQQNGIWRIMLFIIGLFVAYEAIKSISGSGGVHITMPMQAVAKTGTQTPTAKTGTQTPIAEVPVAE